MDRTVLIRDVLEVPARCLGQSMDEAFDRLYDSLFGGVSPNLEDFREAALKYFDTVSGDSTRQDEYFVCFTPVWNFYLADGKRGDAEGLWRLALDPVLLWQNANPGQFIHKGTAYYFWAMTALLQGGIDRGYILMHQAFAEDCRTSGNPRPYTPAFAFVSLESDEPNQAFKDWVQEQARFLDGFVKDYSATFSRPFTIDEFRKRYLRNPPVIDAVSRFFRKLPNIPQAGHRVR